MWANKNEQFQTALTNIDKIISELNIKNENPTDTINERNKNIIKGIENVINGKIDPNIIIEPEKKYPIDENISGKENITNTLIKEYKASDSLNSLSNSNILQLSYFMIGDAVRVKAFNTVSNNSRYSDFNLFFDWIGF